MGVGTPIDLLEAVHRGVDMFDCILPTSVAQHGDAFTSVGRIDLRRGAHRYDESPIDPACTCEACTRYSRSFVHHLVKCGEPLAWQLIAHHNLAFYLGLVRAMRAHILDGSFDAFYRTQREIHAPVVTAPPRSRHKPEPTTRGNFALHVTETHTSIRHVPSGELMHSVNDPDDEARRVYVEQSPAIAQALAGRREIVVWDVGLGAAHNAMALVRALDEADHAAVSLHSFEIDLDALHLALAHTKHFPHVRHAAPHILAHRGHFTRERFTWTLHRGDFVDTFRNTPQPDVIFWDPFSSKVDAPLWSEATFRSLASFLARPVELYTYSCSTAVRAAMTAAGFRVAPGVPSGPKRETTIATAGTADG
jgi:queuine tRNA-ribosyltransferase